MAYAQNHVNRSFSKPYTSPSACEDKSTCGWDETGVGGLPRAESKGRKEAPALVGPFRFFGYFFLKKVTTQWEKIILLIGCLIVSTNGIAQDIRFRLLTTANIADLSLDDPFWHQTEAFLRNIQEPFCLLINGDLIATTAYPRLTTPDSIRIERLVGWFDNLPLGQLVLLPGDRDWDDNGPQGWESVQALEAFVKRRKTAGVRWPVDDGCPGPKVLELTQDLDLVCIQTQWWNHPYERPRPADATCKIATEEDFLEALEDAIKESQDRDVVIAGHFPLTSLGEYGGRMPLKSHIFPFYRNTHGQHIPLPLVGSMITAYRQNIGRSKDIVNHRFADIRQTLEDVFLSNRSLIYLSGHEHNLQILRKEDNYLINSGSPAKAFYTGNSEEAHYAQKERGLIEITYHTDGKTTTSVHVYEPKKGFEKDWGKVLFLSTCILNPHAANDSSNEITPLSLSSQIPFNLSFGFCGDNPLLSIDGSTFFDSTLIQAAGPVYKAGGLKKFFWGKHYRDAWTTPVAVSYLNLDTLRDGLEMVKIGGGHETQSIRFLSPYLKEFNFRSIAKNPVNRLSYDLRSTIAGYILQDQTSSQIPYGALTLPPLMDALDILHPSPHLYLLPPDQRLGIYQENFGHMMGLFEENPKGPVTGKLGFGGADEVRRSFRFFRELYQNHDALVDKTAYATARVFDILIGDWARHEDNWKWAGFQLGDQMVYRPIPRDRDQAFSLRDGLFPWLADRRWIRPQGEHFGYSIGDVHSLTWSARHLDRLLGNQLDHQQWQFVAEDVQHRLTDSLIALAIKRLPPEVYAKDGQKIIKKLISRRDELGTSVHRFYHLLAKEVDVVGSNMEEYFEVVRAANGSVEVFMYNRDREASDQKGNKFYYYRKFVPDETKEVRLFGLGGDDVFVLRGKSPRSILVRVVGGPGADIIQDSSRVGGPNKRTWVYERDTTSQVNLGREGKFVYNVHDNAFNYDRKAFAYDQVLPLPYIAFNRDDHFLFSMGVELIDQKYGKFPYNSWHTFRGTIAENGSYGLRYRGHFRQVFENWDLALTADIESPTRFFYFFGLGNNTTKDQALFDQDFYRTRYDAKRFSIGLNQAFWGRSHFYMGFRYENNEPQIQAHTILFSDEYQDLFGREKANLLFGRIELDLDLRDNRSLPMRGMRLFLQHDNGIATNVAGKIFAKNQGSLEYFSTIRGRMPLTLGLKIGAGHSLGPVPFYHLFSLGDRNHLRGYFRNRFTGRSVTYFNSELRWQIANLSSVSVPIRLGIKAFFDVGRVYMEKEPSQKFHTGYGVGLFIVPYKERFTLTFSTAFSKEENLYLRFSIGVPFR